jgi:hypothetical protein
MNGGVRAAQARPGTSRRQGRRKDREGEPHPAVDLDGRVLVCQIDTPAAMTRCGDLIPTSTSGGGGSRTSGLHRRMEPGFRRSGDVTARTDGTLFRFLSGCGGGRATVSAPGSDPAGHR